MTTQNEVTDSFAPNWLPYFSSRNGDPFVPFKVECQICDRRLAITEPLVQKDYLRTVELVGILRSMLARGFLAHQREIVDKSGMDDRREIAAVNDTGKRAGKIERIDVNGMIEMSDMNDIIEKIDVIKMIELSDMNDMVVMIEMGSMIERIGTNGMNEMSALNDTSGRAAMNDRGKRAGIIERIDMIEIAGSSPISKVTKLAPPPVVVPAVTVTIIRPPYRRTRHLMRFQFTELTYIWEIGPST
ncbi:hypothetical protein FHL15_006437 [Xylaria flabelliformis]|uniref:Uncharacterized protein n=1 Tax=Xylaria flabelliformis TaxID=2512241 RepID=A0A553HXT0_9PEZI|nr:hypothetical protein FHL15_006437 [Xylaria flabelliformis]